jgi:hypothetical protein
MPTKIVVGDIVLKVLLFFDPVMRVPALTVASLVGEDAMIL